MQTEQLFLDPVPLSDHYRKIFWTFVLRFVLGEILLQLLPYTSIVSSDFRGSGGWVALPGLLVGETDNASLFLLLFDLPHFLQPPLSCVEDSLELLHVEVSEYQF